MLLLTPGLVLTTRQTTHRDLLHATDVSVIVRAGAMTYGSEGRAGD